MCIRPHFLGENIMAYTYKTVNSTDGQLTDAALSALGADGWLLVSFVNTGILSWSYIFYQ